MDIILICDLCWLMLSLQNHFHLSISVIIKNFYNYTFNLYFYNISMHHLMKFGLNLNNFLSLVVA